MWSRKVWVKTFALIIDLRKRNVPPFFEIVDKKFILVARNRDSEGFVSVVVKVEFMGGEGTEKTLTSRMKAKFKRDNHIKNGHKRAPITGLGPVHLPLHVNPALAKGEGRPRRLFKRLYF